MRPTIIYFVRHGEVYNPKKVLYGRLPGFSLSNEGKKRITEISKYFKDKNSRYLYSSPLLRTRQTARIIGKSLRLIPKISYLLNEVGIYCQGIQLSEYKNNIQPHMYDQVNLDKGQESLESIKNRMTKFLNMIVKKHNGITVIVVSHGDPITILKATLENKMFTWKYKLDSYIKTGHWIKVTCNEDKCEV